MNIATSEELLALSAAGSMKVRENCLLYPLLQKMSLRTAVASTLADFFAGLSSWQVEQLSCNTCYFDLLGLG